MYRWNVIITNGSVCCWLRRVMWCGVRCCCKMWYDLALHSFIDLYMYIYIYINLSLKNMTYHFEIFIPKDHPLSQPKSSKKCGSIENVAIQYAFSPKTASILTKILQTPQSHFKHYRKTNKFT